MSHIFKPPTPWGWRFVLPRRIHACRTEALLIVGKEGLPSVYCLGAVATDRDSAKAGGPCYVFTELFEYNPELGARAFDAIYQIQSSEGGTVIVDADTLEKVMRQRIEQELGERGLV